LILADIDVLIDYLAGVEPTTSQIRGYIEADWLQTSAVTYFELLSGVRPGKRGDAIRTLLDAVAVLPLDRVAANRAAQVRRELDRAGQPIGLGDCLIAGIALAYGLSLFTRNRKHFDRVPNLSLIALRPSAQKP
jgi:tRNA(fMet)-specific endonuclease VapC